MFLGSLQYHPSPKTTALSSRLLYSNSFLTTRPPPTTTDFLPSSLLPPLSKSIIHDIYLFYHQENTEIENRLLPTVIIESTVVPVLKYFQTHSSSERIRQQLSAGLLAFFALAATTTTISTKSKIVSACSCSRHHVGNTFLRTIALDDLHQIQITLRVALDTESYSKEIQEATTIQTQNLPISRLEHCLDRNLL